MNKISIHIVYILLVFIIVSCEAKGKNNEFACNGNTRREVKVMIDNAVDEIDTAVIFTTIDSLGSIQVGDVDSDTPRLPVERKVFSVRGKVEKVKRYRDGDYHIKLVDENGKYIITEVPNPQCEYALNSIYLDHFISIQSWIKEHENSLEGTIVTISGVAFVDIDHYYKRDQAVNNIELHPILSISF